MAKSNFPVKRIEQITRLDTEVKLMNEKIDSLSVKLDVQGTKLDTFINSADAKYASNTRVDALAKQIANTNFETKQNKKDIDKLMDWLAKWSAPIAIVCYIVLKGVGIV